MAPSTAEAPRPLAALTARVGAAADALPERERTALALCEREGAGYGDIAGALGLEPDAVPALLLAARTGVRAGVRGSVPPPMATPACPRARRLLTMRHDGELHDPDEVA